MAGNTIPAPTTHHLDKRADAIADTSGRADDDLLSTPELAAWLGVSVQFLNIGRLRGYGPRFHKLSPRRCKYRVGDVKQWLRERTYQSTSEYMRRR